MNRNLTIVLVVIFAGLLLYVLVVQMPKDKAAASVTGTAPVTTYLWSFTADKVTGVHIVDRVQGQQVAFAKDAGGAWSITAPTPQPADQATAGVYASELTTLVVDNTFTTVTDLAAFGVLSPTYTIEINLSDGSKLTAAIGDKAPTGSDYYVLRGGEKNIVALSSTSLTTLTSMITVPPVVPPTATATVPTPGPGTPSVTPPAPQRTAQTPARTLVVTATSQTPVGTLGVTATSQTLVETPGATATAVSTRAAATATP